MSKRISFEIRAGMANTALNFSKDFPNSNCQLSCLVPEDYGHILICPKVHNIQQQHVIDYEKVFGNNIKDLNSLSKLIHTQIEDRNKYIKSLQKETEVRNKS